MKLIDMHCDTISRLMDLPFGKNLIENELCINLEGMQKAGTLAQFFACFVHAASYEGDVGEGRTEKRIRTEGVSSEAWDRAYKAALEMAGRIDREQNAKLKAARSYAEIVENSRNGVISAIKTAEEGGILNGDIKRLDALYDAGIRLITLTWNYPNCIGYPNSRNQDVMERGLTAFGMQTVERMNELRMMVDVSHLSDGGFWDCISYSKAPVCASHSNAWALCRHPRNLSDDMLKALGRTGGVAGLNFYPAFLREDEKVTLDDLARHAAYMMNVGGEDLIAIGTDFDGFDNAPRSQWIGHVREMEKVWAAMRKRGITPRQLDKIMGDNALRYIKTVLV